MTYSEHELEFTFAKNRSSLDAFAAPLQPNIIAPNQSCAHSSSSDCNYSPNKHSCMLYTNRGALGSPRCLLQRRRFVRLKLVPAVLCASRLHSRRSPPATPYTQSHPQLVTADFNILNKMQKNVHKRC